MRSLPGLVGLVLCIHIFPVQKVFGQNCKFVQNGEEIPDNGFGFSLQIIQDIEKPGKELLVTEASNVKNITDVSWTSQHHYMEPILNSSHLVLKLTDDFANYEEYEFSRTMSITVTFACDIGTRQIEFVQPIEDTNNHDPVFQEAPYLYKLPMPFPKNFALNNFSPISARDIDLTNTNISFSLDNTASGFSISWLSMDLNDRKMHYATLVTTSIITLVEDLTFKIYATDTGVPPRTSSTNVTIKVDQENSIMRFARSLYIANLTNLKPSEADGTIINFAEGEIGLASGADKTVEYNIKDEFSDYDENFKLITAEDHSSVSLRLANLPETFFQENFVLLSLVAKKAGATETTVLHIFLPGYDKTVSQPDSKECEECGNSMVTIVLSVFLGIVAFGLIVSVFQNYRHWRNSKHESTIRY